MLRKQLFLQIPWSLFTLLVPSERQSIKFLDECLIRKSVSLYDNIKLNKLPLFRQRIECKPTRAEWTVRLLKADCQPFSKFYIAFQSRAGIWKTSLPTKTCISCVRIRIWEVVQLCQVRPYRLPTKSARAIT